MTATPLDARWRRAHPLPALGAHADKDARGHVVVVGGSFRAAGALLLAGDAALRAGAGRVQIAVPPSIAAPLGLHLPEAGLLPLAEPAAPDQPWTVDDAAVRDQVAHCDTLLIGPGMMGDGLDPAPIARLVAACGPDTRAVLDAGAIAALPACAPLQGRPAIITPHHGELARLLDVARATVGADPLAHAQTAAERFGAVVVLKDALTHIVAPGGDALVHVSPCQGLGTGGSGDVLAGVIAGLCARGADPIVAASWGVWLHGAAGETAAHAIGPLGFRASELARHIPMLMDRPGA